MSKTSFEEIKKEEQISYSKTILKINKLEEVISKLEEKISQFKKSKSS